MTIGLPGTLFWYSLRWEALRGNGSALSILGDRNTNRHDNYCKTYCTNDPTYHRRASVTSRTGDWWGIGNWAFTCRWCKAPIQSIVTIQFGCPVTTTRVSSEIATGIRSTITGWDYSSSLNRVRAKTFRRCCNWSTNCTETGCVFNPMNSLSTIQLRNWRLFSSSRITTVRTSWTRLSIALPHNLAMSDTGRTHFFFSVAWVTLTLIPLLLPWGVTFQTRRGGGFHIPSATFIIVTIVPMPSGARRCEIAVWYGQRTQNRFACWSNRLIPPEWIVTVYGLLLRGCVFLSAGKSTRVTRALSTSEFLVSVFVLRTETVIKLYAYIMHVGQCSNLSMFHTGYLCMVLNIQNRNYSRRLNSTFAEQESDRSPLGIWSAQDFGIHNPSAALQKEPLAGTHSPEPEQISQDAVSSYPTSQL